MENVQCCERIKLIRVPAEPNKYFHNKDPYINTKWVLSYKTQGTKATKTYSPPSYVSGKGPSI